MSLAQFVILKEVNVQNTSCWWWHWSPSLVGWGGSEPKLYAGYGPTTLLWESHPLFPANMRLEMSPWQAILWGTTTTSTCAAACLLQRISWYFQETESKQKCSSTLKEDKALVGGLFSIWVGSWLRCSSACYQHGIYAIWRQVGSERKENFQGGRRQSERLLTLAARRSGERWKYQSKLICRRRKSGTENQHLMGGYPKYVLGGWYLPSRQ